MASGGIWWSCGAPHSHSPWQATPIVTRISFGFGMCSLRGRRSRSRRGGTENEHRTSHHLRIHPRQILASVGASLVNAHLHLQGGLLCPRYCQGGVREGTRRVSRFRDRRVPAGEPRPPVSSVTSEPLDPAVLTPSAGFPSERWAQGRHIFGAVCRFRAQAQASASGAAAGARRR